MANAYFQFKEFMVRQDKTAMKVCTDACLFGAWTAEKCRSRDALPGRILDIGTGTGLLSLMLAQMLPGRIEALEIDRLAYSQALENISNSAWSNRIVVLHHDVRDFNPGGGLTKDEFDLIISNPPFFENDLRSDHAGKNLAKHEVALELSTLFELASGWLSNTGHFALLLPAHRKQKALQAAENAGMHARYITMVSNSTLHKPFRVMFLFCKQKLQSEPTELFIKENGVYTAAFTELLKPYYLYL